ncbi:nucleotide exchange factor GrpE [Calothrix sp. UHCC 0171]|uniref:nucleotide exchange factor GrpE n=1 Tax=Calothrix sp. UHCC 0171 TaxID=3110245 RepID=UPI002B202933|nr:nucleotide exchange factor GrpE [Calothrix sp. UHCC 0171]MEA5571025.1 nucleotide exchange factor GrpE [Calothrix sp. UHCC 0171]
MVNENKLLETITQQSGDLTEVTQAMNSDSPEINVNVSGSEATEQAVSANVTTDTNNVSDSENSAAETGNKDSEVSSQTTQQIESLKTQVEQSNNQYMRLVADFDNYRKRTAKEKEDLDTQVKRNTITELLPVVDNFERARAQIKPQDDGELAIHKSYQSVYKQLVDCLKRLGVSPMRPEGQPFDPNLHEAVMREPTDEHPEGTVLEELVRGYFLGDRVLRHAMVKVAAPKEDTPDYSDSQSSPADS